MGKLVIPPSPKMVACRKRTKDMERKAVHGPKSKERLATPRPCTEVPPGKGMAMDMMIKEKADRDAK